MDRDEGGAGRDGEAGPEPARQLGAIVEADFDKKVCAHKKLAVWFAFWGQAKYRPNYLKIHNRYDEERYEEIGRICTRLTAEGGYADIAPDRAARTIEAMIDGMWLSLMLYPAITDRDECRRDCFETLALLFPRHFDGDGAK